VEIVTREIFKKENFVAKVKSVMLMVHLFKVNLKTENTMDMASLFGQNLNIIVDYFRMELNKDTECLISMILNIEAIGKMVFDRDTVP
jgi:hypothetical protein